MNCLGKTLAFLLLAATLAMFPAAPAHADLNDSGSKNCTGNGRIFLFAGYKPYYGVNVAVKQAGPAGGPSWGATLAADTSVAPGAVLRQGWLSPYDEGTWSAHTEGDHLQTGVQCSRQELRSGDPDATVSLGDKTCTDSKAWVTANSGAEIWISFKRLDDGLIHRVKFPGSDAHPFNEFNTRDKTIYDVVVRIYNGEWNALALHCGPPD